MAIKIIAVTTEYASIAKMLGVENENEYSLYQETKKGKYYARFLPDSTFEEKLVRLISYEKAAELESSAVATIKENGKKIQEIIASAPIINLDRFHKNIEAILFQSKARAKKMGQDIRSSLEYAGAYN